MVNRLLAFVYCDQASISCWHISSGSFCTHASVFKYGRQAYEHASKTLKNYTHTQTHTSHKSNELSKMGTKICFNFTEQWGKGKAAIAEMSQAITHTHVCARARAHTHTHTHTPSSLCVCLAANIIMVLTALVNSSTQNKLSGSVGASSGEFHSKVCALRHMHVCVCACLYVLSLSLNYNPLFQSLHKHMQNSQ